mmetsp:Transcript_11937/g.13694  ORF Transcript_11937/g.13694 Transcript_11937/m.13694 type:complete len:328 (+) Transcript_11937:59-1042(+)
MKKMFSTRSENAASFTVVILIVTNFIVLLYVRGFHQQSRLRFGSLPTISVSHRNGNQFKDRMRYFNDTSLFMGKLRNRQAELQKKMVLAKQQAAEEKENNDDSSGVDSRLTDEEIKEQNDRKRFEKLLKSNTAATMSIANGDKFLSDNYLTTEQEEETIDAYRQGVDRIFEGDPASSEVFEELVSVKSEKGAVQLLPWLCDSNKSDYVIVVSDPREKSIEFRSTIKCLESELPKDIFNKIVFINADTPSENRKALGKMKLADSSIRLFSDEKREWMQTYTALGENRWSLTLFVLAEGRVQSLVREFSHFSCSSVIQNAINATEKRRL